MRNANSARSAVMSFTSSRVRRGPLAQNMHACHPSPLRRRQLKPRIMEISLLALIPAGAYLLGSIPFGLLFTWIFGGGDVRKGGSGNSEEHSEHPSSMLRR